MTPISSNPSNPTLMGASVRLVVLASGRGSNFQAIGTAVMEGRIPNAEVVGLICNKRQAPVLEVAAQLGVPTVCLPAKELGPEYETQLLEAIRSFRPDLICLAGYMKILSKEIIQAFPGKILNIHPSLLPQFRGLRAQQQALEAGVSQTGCTVHWVTESLDDGPVVEQAEVAILPGDTEATLTARLLPVEHTTYVQALQKIVKELAQPRNQPNNQPNKK